VMFMKSYLRSIMELLNLTSFLSTKAAKSIKLSDGNE